MLEMTNAETFLDDAISISSHEQRLAATGPLGQRDLLSDTLPTTTIEGVPLLRQTLVLVGMLSMFGLLAAWAGFLVWLGVYVYDLIF
jgi:hypothetical protein